ncbi:hypothetical protein MY5147_004058 [Beauveria neobassiana]
MSSYELFDDIRVLNIEVIEDFEDFEN